MEHFRLHRRSILTGKVEVVTGANVIALGNNNTAVVEFDDEPGRKRWYTLGDGTGTVDTSTYYDFWVGEPK
ncbi:hypothetical protein FDH38_gp033 [Dinoroseobacter phage vB_DshS-R5C]|uniref:Uncharacterized protein n=1 Tax=Dinoroseobacter phage vB_DshS-R5C TaxID=1965368 RepID=A0A1V0DY78_9CAUD|nr:hypothetical protein FDH38_gp033 [Dinoroseobacter phage vB_DshS-R5C]ARB06087.1 hypothetical protein vBDshSR5C_33 [Dinoroseobacter phage vB_DshS-R5C]